MICLAADEKFDESVILVTHRGVGKILADHPAAKVVDMGECSAASILS